MKTPITQGLLVLRNKISKSFTSIFKFYKFNWIQPLSIVFLIYIAMISMAFVQIDDPASLFSKVGSSIVISNYKGVVTVVNDKAILKTAKVTYLLDDPKKMLHKSPYFVEHSQLQSFRICIEAERSMLQLHNEGVYSYKLTIKDLCE